MFVELDEHDNNDNTNSNTNTNNSNQHSNSSDTNLGWRSCSWSSMWTNITYVNRILCCSIVYTHL